MEQLLQRTNDPNLRFALEFGIGLHHAGLHERDRKIVEELFVNQKIHVGEHVCMSMHMFEIATNY